MAYHFTDICFISENVPVLIKFYETVFDVKAAEDGDEIHSGINAGGLNISIDSAKLVENTAFHYVSGKSSDNCSAPWDGRCTRSAATLWACRINTVS